MVLVLARNLRESDFSITGGSIVGYLLMVKESPGEAIYAGIFIE